jgi:hypothetical protein
MKCLNKYKIKKEKHEKNISDSIRLKLNEKLELKKED